MHNLIAVETKYNIDNLINCLKFSHFQRLIKVTAYFLKAVTLFKSKRTQGNGDSLTVEQLQDAELRWIRDCQERLKQHATFASLKHQLNLFLDPNGLWRCGGRLGNTDVAYSTKFPILLQREHPLTSLIVKDAHA